ncbi:hypothetical protein SM124_19385 [Bacillus sp. 31A1R]|uniref:Secreted protein n=1 Tax=Robertmurraya mangrovi TaxID=3098077 RepID=A0ABU5J3G8_9BACI|nr:hypothetical protein [Bacillus sp. 31A1R]MDZ5473887.1 hypothetical protein [Bacillus sp. 31A1R]
MKKWMFSAILYLALVIGGYFTYDAFFAKAGETDSHDMSAEHETNKEVSHADEESHEEDGHEEGGTTEHSEHAEAAPTESDVVVSLTAENNTLSINLEDKEGKPVTELEVNHEKLLHLIVVDETLEDYYHLHPEQIGEGQFKVDVDLKDGNYKAFVDIKPTNLNYIVQPTEFVIGNPDGHSHGELKADDQLVKTIDGNKVELNVSSFSLNEHVTLTFNTGDIELEPYLGAMGHVVILDEHANEYIHVHPADHEKPIFETEFTKPGLYKIWGEFKQNGKVTAYPFVIEIK